MFAIVRFKGFQYFAKPGEKILVPKLESEVNSSVTIDEVLFLRTEKQALIGSPLVKNASVDAKIVGHSRAAKVTSFKFTRRENYRRLKGHKQHLTELEIGKIKIPSEA